MNKCLVLAFMLFSSCRSLTVIEKAEEVSLRIITHHNDSCEGVCKRYVFSHLPCSEIVLYSKSGKILPFSNSKLSYDSACFTCDEFAKNSSIISSVSYSNTNYFYTISSDGRLQIHNEKCTKPEINLFENYFDSIGSVVLWNKLNIADGKWVFYRAKESFTPPYFEAATQDSFLFDLSHFCTGKEKDDERQGWQDLYNKHVKAIVTPNPFAESFEFTLTAGKIGYFLKGNEMVLTFYDEKGIDLLTKMIDIEKGYQFSFPQVMHGKIIYYRVKWAEYSISGQILKN